MAREWDHKRIVDHANRFGFDCFSGRIQKHVAEMVAEPHVRTHVATAGGKISGDPANGIDFGGRGSVSRAA